MDNNDPANPNSNISGSVPAAPAFDQNSAGTATSAWPTATSENPAPSSSSQILSDVTQLSPGTLPAAAAPGPWETSAAIPQVPAANPTQGNTGANPWDPPATSAMVPAQLPPTNLPQPPWPTPTPAVASPSDVPTAPIVSEAAVQTPDGATGNPFLQPQSGSGFDIPPAPVDQNPPAQTPLPPSETETTVPNPMGNTPPDPLNTAFSPTGIPEQNPFASTQAPLDPQNLMPPGGPSQSVSGQPAPALNPWGQPAAQVSTEASISAVQGNQATDSLKSPDLTASQPGTPDNPPIHDQTIPDSSQSTPLDLSSPQNSSALNPVPSENQPGNPPSQATGTDSQQNETTSPGTNSVENAPTDLSHLIAGDEQSTQPMGNVYNPPVAPDKNPSVNNPQAPAAEGQTPPPGKHLNLTKVLLVAGIPIILVVAALSAYLILGIGKSSPESSTTSLPVEQTQQDQAPLTNPPQQIVPPSPAIIPEPSPDALLPAEPSPVVSGSPTSAMEKLKARQSASPTASSSPASSASTSLPTNP